MLKHTQILKQAVIALMLSTLAFTLTSAAQSTSAQPAPALSDIATFVDATINTQMKLEDISAVTVSIVKDGKIIFAKGYGMQDREKNIPVRADRSLFRIGSTSKLFTWTAVMQQLEKGNLTLDADVNTYLKTFQIPDTFDEPITLKHILTHTAGFEEGGLGYLMAYDPAKMLPLQKALSRYVPQRINKPGAYSAYSNYATALAGLIVQNVSGVPYNEYIQQNILDPLEMNHTTFVEPLPANLKDDYTIGYKRENGTLKPLQFELIGSFGPAGAASATAVDMGKFMLAYLGNGRLGDAQILAPKTVDLMLSPLYSGDDRLAKMTHGFYEEIMNGHRLVGHGGDSTQFHTDLMIDRDEGLGIFVSYVTQTGSKARNEFIPAFYDHYYPEERKVFTPPVDFAERAGKYAGEYNFWRHNESTIEKAVGLAGGITVQPTDNNTLAINLIGEPQEFVEIGKHLFHEVDGDWIVAFGEDEDGNIQDFHVDLLPFMDSTRAPTFQTSFFRVTLPIICFLIFLTVWIGWVYRRKEFSGMSKPEKQAVHFSMAVSGLHLLFIITFVVILSSIDPTDLFIEVPFSLKASLILPLLAVILTLGVVYHLFKAWSHGYWHRGRRIHYTLVALSSLYIAFLYYYWNILGFQFP